MSIPEAVWNRALDFDALPEATSPGDIALRDVLTFHAAVQNGGLVNAIEMHLDDDEFPLARVISGYEYLGLDDVAETITEAQGRFVAADDDEEAIEALELEVDPMYEVEDEDLTQALEGRLRKVPEDFDPAH